MLFIPKKLKFKKEQKGIAFNKIKSKIEFMRLKFGNIGLKTISSSRITSKQLVTIKQSIRKVLKKKGKLKINVFSSTPITQKAIGVRMGKGKGNVGGWVFKIKPGYILCEIATSSIPLAIKALNAAKIRLPIFTKLTYF